MDERDANANKEQPDQTEKDAITCYRAHNSSLTEPVDDARIICSRLEPFNWRERPGKRLLVRRRPACVTRQLTIVSNYGENEARIEPE